MTLPCTRREVWEQNILINRKYIKTHWILSSHLRGPKALCMWLRKRRSQWQNKLMVIGFAMFTWSFFSSSSSSSSSFTWNKMKLDFHCISIRHFTLWITNFIVLWLRANTLQSITTHAIGGHELTAAGRSDWTRRCSHPWSTDGSVLCKKVSERPRHQNHQSCCSGRLHVWSYAQFCSGSAFAEAMSLSGWTSG